jgi:opacity protein-like surface antigen
MRKAFRWGVAVAVITLILPSVASAENFYAAVRGGPGWTPDNATGRVGFEDVDTYKLGFTGGAAVGYAFPFGLRAEGELGFIYAPLDTEGGVEVSGSVKNYLLMANVYYDIKIPALGPLRPYIGGGIGGARENRDHQFLLGGVKVDADNWRTAFAYQARAGVIYDVNEWLDLSAGYRYVHINGGDQTFGAAKVHFDATDNHSVELGFAIKF